MGLYPSQFEVNEAWIVFQLNDAPLVTEKDGNFNVFALMDAASCYILGAEFVPVESAELSQLETRRLLKGGQFKTQRFPKKLLLPADQPAEILSMEARRHGIDVVRVADEQLQAFIGEARHGLREHLQNKGA